MIVVTGAGGHIGANLVRELLRRGEKVRAVVHERTRALDGLPVETVHGDVLDRATLESAFDGADFVHHLAGRISIVPDDREMVTRVNVLGVRNVVEACLSRKVKRLTHYSSIHALAARPRGAPVDETRPYAGADQPHYDRSKAAGEREVQAGVKRGLDAVIVNPTGVIGPHDYAPSRMGEVFLDLYHRRLPGLVSGSFNWVDVRDVVLGALAVAERGRTGERYLLSGHRATVREYARLVEEVTGVRPPLFITPMWLARGVAPAAMWYARTLKRRPLFTTDALHALRNHRIVLHDKATREVGYAPRPLRETIADVYAWFKSENVI